MANIITKNIPNTITCCNLISGCTATAFAFSGQLNTAFLFIVLGAVFDFFDGMTARLLNVSSPIGKELDSLADCITFGFAPSTMVFYELNIINYPSFAEPLRDILPFSAFIMAAFSALRLAKFNLDERQATSFIGMPTPANALFWASLLVGGGRVLESSVYALPVILVLMAACCYILISEIPMFALKFKQWGWKGNEIKYIFIITCVPLLITSGISSFAIIIAWYVILSIYVNIKSNK